ncbi:MAG: queuosine salvage family protein [Candidatus Saccharibacteria bacterium]
MLKNHEGTLKQDLQKLRRMSHRIVKNGSITPCYDKLAVLIEDLVNSPSEDHIIISSDKLNFQSKIALTLLFGCVNYCYVNPIDQKEYKYNYDGIVLYRSSAFVNALINSGLDWSNFNLISNLTYEEWSRLLQLSDDNTLYNADVRFDTIKTFAKYLSHVDLNNFYDIYDSFEDVYQLLVSSGLFNDLFLKRIQISLSMIDQLAKRYHVEFSSEIKLSAMADYRLPQVLYNYGVLHINEELKDKLVSHSPIISGDSSEVELRAWTVIICEIIAKKLNISESQVDGMIWNLSQKLIIKNEQLIPAMLVMTDSY